MRRLPILAALAAAFGVVLGPVVAAAALPGHSVVFTPAKGKFGQSFEVYAASPDYVVYSESPAWYYGPTAPERFYVRSGSGQPRRLQIPAGLLSNGFDHRFSLVGSRLTFSSGPDLHWWDLVAGTHGSATLPNDQDYVVGTSPDGWVYATGNGQLFDQPASGGNPSSVPSPFGEAFGAVTGDSGLAIVNPQQNGLDFIPWGSSTATTLNIDSSQYNDVACDVLADASVGCTADTPNDVPSFQAYVLRVPTNGAAPVVTTLPGGLNSPTVSLTSTATLWLNWETSRVQSVPASANGPITTSTYGGLTQTAPSSGRFVVTQQNNGQQSLRQTSDAATPLTTIVAADQQQAHASAVALSANRVIYTDDEKDYAAGDLWSRSLSGHDQVSVGRPSLLVPSHATSGSLSLSESTTVGSSDRGIRVITPHRKTLLPPTAVGAVATNKWVVYGQTNQAGLWKYNLSTHHAAVLVHKAGIFGASGNVAAYCRADDSVWIVNLATNKQRALSKPLGKSERSRTSCGPVLVYGNYVAWQLNGRAGPKNYYRSTKSGAKLHTVPSKYTLASLSDDGLLVYVEHTGSSTQTSTWYLHKLGGTKYRAVLTLRYLSYSLYEVPPSIRSEQVAVGGGRVAWIGSDRRAHVAPLPKSLR